MDVYNNSNPFIFGIPYDDIQSCDITTVLTALNSFLESRERVVFGRGRFTLLVEGYDDDPRDVWDIGEVRQYFKELDAKFPYWFYFVDLNHQTLGVLGLCLCRVLKVNGGSTPNPDDLKQFLVSHVLALNELCTRFGLPDEVRNEITRDAFAILVPSSKS